MASPEDDIDRAAPPPSGADMRPASADDAAVPVPIATTPSMRSRARSIPPPLPLTVTERRRRPTIGKSEGLPTRPEQPTVVDRALAQLAELDDAARAAQLARELEAAANADPIAAAAIAYELGELCERRLDQADRAMAAYRRACALDPSLRPARWALRRSLYLRSAWDELAALIEAEIAGVTTDHERLELQLERAIVLGHRGDADAAARDALEAATKIEPQHVNALLELERVVAKVEDPLALRDAWERLAEALEPVEHKVAYWLEVARHAAEGARAGAATADAARAQRALDTAARLAASAPSRTREVLRERVARERLRLADEHGTPEAAAAALDGLIQLLAEAAAAGRSRELVALRRRRALQLRATAPARAWQTLQHALALVPDDPAILVELIELAAELGHADELARLIDSWRAVERADGRAAIIAGWVGELARVAEPTRGHRRAVLQALGDNGALLLASTAEAHALSEPLPRGLAELAAIYAALARAAAEGRWIAHGAPAPDAAVALYLQAAHVLAYHVATPDAIAEARTRLDEARAIAPAHPGVREALIELDDATGHPVDALGQLAAQAAAAAPGEARAIRERAMRVAWAHVNDEPACIAAVRALERALVADAPDDAALAWRLAASLEGDARAGATDDLERLALLDRLARTEGDAKRRATAVFLAARLHAQRGNADAAIAHHRALRALWPDDETVRDELRALLRRHARWTELVQERREELAEADAPTARRVLREAAWVLEHRLDDVAQAARVYDAWRARMPDDRTALEGVARCRAALGDAEAELAARAEIRERDATREARWLHAHALERAGHNLDAIAAYQALLADEVGDDTAVDAATGDDGADIVAASAALALGELAERTGDLALRASAATALATRTRDPRLGAALLEDVGWTAAIALADFDRAAQAFEAALALAPGRPGALLGAALVAARRTDPERHAAHLVELAGAVPALAAPLLLRAAAIAAAEGDPAQADARIDAARRAAPDDLHALVVACEAAPPPVVETGDPFAAFDQQLERAEQLEKRAALSDDPAARVAWELERAWVLEQAGQLHEACAILSTVLRIDAKDWRAITALRRIAHRAGDRATCAAASYALARRSRDPQLRLRLLRDAADVYDRPGTSSPELALTIYRRILASDPGAPELDRLLEMLRQRGDARELLAALTTRLAWLTGERPDDARAVAELVQRLLDRANVLQRLGQHGASARDLDAVLALAPHHAEAQRQRTASPWQPDPTVTDAGDDEEDERDDAGVTHDALRAQPSDDPFGNATALVDVSALQDQERRVARARSSAYDDVEVTNEERALGEPGDSAGDLAVTALAVPRITATIASPPPPPPPRVRDTDAVPVARVPALDLAAMFPGAAPPPEGDAAYGPEPMLDADAIKLPDEEQLSLDDSAVVMLSLEQLQPARSDDATRDLLASYERELALGDAGRGLSLRLEAARLAELLDEPDRARQHFEAARASDPRATVAMRGLRRLARAGAELAELTELLDAELAVVGAREREPLRRYRLDLWMATGAHDAARAELLATGAHDPSALLAQLELALRGDRGAELATALEHLATALEPHPALRGALATARAVLAVHGRDASAARWRAIAADAEPGAPAARIAAIHRAVADDARDAAAGALLDLAYHVEGADPELAAALALRAQLWAIDRGAPLSDAARDTASNAAQLASQAAPRDALVARIAAEAARRAGDTATASHAYARWARSATLPVERAHAAACAAELEPARLGRLWAQVLEHDPGDDYAAARLRDAYLAAGERALAIELDVPAQGTEVPSPAAFLRAAAVWREARAPVRKPSASDAAPREALALLEQGRAAHPSSLAIAEALADALADAGRWAERAALRAAIADEAEPLARDIARLRAAVAAEQAARKADPSTGDEREAAALAAIDAWDLVLADDPRAAHAHAAQLSLAARLRDPSVLLDALARAEASERAPWVANSLALRRARLVAAHDPRQAQDIAGQRRDDGDARIGVEVGYGARSPISVDDPRRTLAVMLAAAQRGELGDAATALDDRAAALEARGDSTREPAALRLRAAQLALAAGDAPRALRWLVQIAPALPGLTADLIDAAQHRAGDATLPIARVATPEASDAFTRVLRDAELAEARDHGAAALALYQRALALRPGDPLATAPLIRLATAVRDQLPIAALALEQIRAADAALDPVAKASAYELLARAEALRDDAASAQLALESAIKADPSRVDLIHRLEHQLAAAQRWPALLYLRELQIDQLERSVTDPDATQPGGRDLGAMIMDATILAVRAKRSEATLADLYRAVLDTDPRHRLAVFHLASIVRRAGGSEELASLEERLADELDDPRSKAAFLTRAGETLARLARPVDAIQRFARAVRVLPGHRPALAAWQRTALASELWLDAAEAVIHTAKLGGEPHQVAALHHLAGVLRMDRAHADDLAIAALRAALELAPDHLDSFVRLRMLLTQRNARDELAALLRGRLEVEPDPTSQIELHRMLADHGAETGDRDAAMLHYRAVLGIDPADVRAHAAIADLASEQGNWQNAAHAINARIPLEHEPGVLRSLHFRLGALYAEREPAKAIAAFQRALHYKPGDEATLIRLTDLAIAARDWQLAFNACDQLVTTERDPDKLAVHLHRAATIFARGMNDHERASRMLQLAFDSAPTNPEALRRLIAFFEGGDPVALRAQLERVATAMRARVAASPRDAAAYRILSRALAARPGAPLHAARAAAELAHLLGTAGEPEQRLLAMPAMPAPRPTEERLFAGAAQPALRHVLRASSAALIKHLGADIAAHGVGRRERLAAQDPLAITAREVATQLGFKDLEVYVSTRHPHRMAAEPTSPVSLILGASIITGDPTALRFAAGGPLALAQLGLALPARLALDELGSACLAAVRIFQPAIAAPGFDGDRATALATKLRRAMSSAALEEARPHALAIEALRPDELARDLKLATLRAGVAAAGRLMPALALLATAAGSDPRGVLGDALAQGVIRFALED